MPEIYDDTLQAPSRTSPPNIPPAPPPITTWQLPPPGTVTYAQAISERSAAYNKLKAERDAYVATLGGEYKKDALGRWGTYRETTDAEAEAGMGREVFVPDERLTQYESALAWMKDSENNPPDAGSKYWSSVASAAGSYAAADPAKKAAADFDEFLNRALGAGTAESRDLDIKKKRQDMNIDVLNYNMGRNKAVQSGAANPFEGVMATDRTGPAPGDPTSMTGISSMVRDSLGNRDAFGGSNSFLDVLKGMGIPGFAGGTTPNTSNVVFGIPIGGATYPQWKALVIKDLANRWANGDRGETVNITGAGFGDPDPSDAPGRDISARTLLAYANFVDAALKNPGIANSATFAPYGPPPQPSDSDFVLTPEEQANQLAKEQWQATFDRQGQWHEDDLKAQQVSEARADARFQAQMGAEMARAQMQAALQAQGIAIDQARLAAEVAYQEAKLALDNKMFELDTKKFDWSKEQFNSQMGFEMSKFEYEKLSDAEKMAFDRERFGYQQLKDATDFAFEKSKFDQQNHQFDLTYNLQKFAQQQDEQFRRDNMSQEQRQFELGLAQDESQFVRNLDWQKEQAALAQAVEAEKLKLDRAGKVAALGANPADAIQREYFLRGMAEPTGTAVDAFTGEVANGGQQMTLSQVMEQNAPALRPFAQAGFGGGQQPQTPHAAAGLGVTHAPKFIVGDSLSGKPTGHEELVVNPTGAPLSVVPISKMYQTKQVPRFAEGTNKTTVPGLASDGNGGGFKGFTFGGSGGVANVSPVRPKPPQGFGGTLGQLFTGDAGAAAEQDRRNRMGMVYDPMSGQWYYPNGAPQAAVQQSPAGPWTDEYGQFNGQGMVGTVAGEAQGYGADSSGVIQGNTGGDVGSVIVGSPEWWANYENPYSGGGQDPLSNPVWINYATAAGQQTNDLNAYNAWVAAGMPATYTPPVVPEPPPVGPPPVVPPPPPAVTGQWVNQNNQWYWVDPTNQGSQPPGPPPGIPDTGQIYFDTTTGQWMYGTPATNTGGDGGQQPGTASAPAMDLNYNNGIMTFQNWLNGNAPSDAMWAQFMAQGAQPASPNGQQQPALAQPVADAGLTDQQRNQLRFGGWNFDGVTWTPPPGAAPIPGFAAGTGTTGQTLLDLLRQALGINVLSYGDDAYQDLPVLQYLSGKIGSAQYNTPGAMGSAIPALGVNLGSPGSLNYQRVQDIERSPSTKALISSLYKAGNRDWDSEAALSKANAPTGSAFAPSLIRT